MLLPAALASAAAIIVVALLPHGVAVAPAVALAALAGGAFPPLGPCLRTLWPRLLGDDPGRMHAAFSLEATSIVGPVVIAGAVGAWSTAAARAGAARDPVRRLSGLLAALAGGLAAGAALSGALAEAHGAGAAFAAAGVACALGAATGALGRATLRTQGDWPLL